jgi:predicted metal-dependent phosphoesterase TrpH
VELLALTDHDVTDGLDEARAAAEAAGIRFLPGVEISTTWEGMTIHIVGLGIDPASTILQAGLKRLRDIRHERAAEIDRRLAKHRIPGTLAGAAALARGAIVSRTHFARYLLSQGYVTGIGQALLQTHGINDARKFQHNLAGVAGKPAPAKFVIKPQHQGIAPVMTKPGDH